MAELLKYERPVTKFQSLPRYPAVDRDLAVIVSEEVPVGALVEELKQAGGSLLQTIDIFDVYQGKQVEPGKKVSPFPLFFKLIAPLQMKRLTIC